MAAADDGARAGAGGRAVVLAQAAKVFVAYIKFPHIFDTKISIGIQIPLHWKSWEDNK